MYMWAKWLVVGTSVVVWMVSEELRANQPKREELGF
jgi:hypothetical protein